MKLIEYKPRKTFIVDISVLPENLNMDISEILKLFNEQKLEWKYSEVKEIDSSESWIHPDYIVKEKTFSELIEIVDKLGPTPNCMKGNSLNHLLYEFPDPEGLDQISYETWEAAKPKLNPEFGKALFFGTSGESDRDIAKKFGIPLKFPDDDFEIHWLAESHIQEAEWKERKRKCPSLTVKDLQWVDKMVDKIYEKHTRNHSREAFYYHIESYTRSHFKKFFGPLS